VKQTAWTSAPGEYFHRGDTLMSTFQATALKHRPQTFGALVGQDHVATTLSNAIQGGRIGHAYLFSGPRGVGKTSTARILAKSLNCEHGPTPSPCGVCSNCTEITSSMAIDVYEIDGASNNGVDQIRDLRENVRFSPAKSRYKIYIIDEVHMLTSEAFNALLKTLEEPPEFVVFIFATTEPERVKITIRSRCQHYRFKRISSQMMAEHLRAISAQQQVSISEGALQLIARAADGSMRDAQSLFDQIVSYAGGTIEEEHVRDITGMFSNALFFDFFVYILDKDVKSMLDRIVQMDDEGLDFSGVVSGLSLMLRNLVLVSEGAGAQDLEMNQEDYGMLQNFYDARGQDGFSQDDAVILVNLLNAVAKDLYTARNPRQLLELAAFRLVQFRDYVRPELILERIESLQRRLNHEENFFQSGGIPVKKAGHSLPIEMEAITAGESTTPPKPVPPRPQQHAPVDKPAAPAAVQAPLSAPAAVQTPPAPPKPAPAAPAPPPVKPPAPPQPVKPQKPAAQPGGGDEAVSRAFGELRDREAVNNKLFATFLSSITEVRVNGRDMVLSFPPDRSFHKEQVEQNYSEQILSFLAERLNVNYRLRCVYADKAAPAVSGPEVYNEYAELLEEPPPVPDGAELIRETFSGEYVDEQYND
jgi:DNA polymerase III subunit gamma/tau